MASMRLVSLVRCFWSVLEKNMMGTTSCGMAIRLKNKDLPDNEDANEAAAQLLGLKELG